MTIIYIAENNTKRYGVTCQNYGYVEVQKFEDISEEKNILYEVNPVEAFVVKSQLCDMTEFSGAEDRAVFNGNTILLKIAEESIKHRFVYIGGDLVCSFITNDRICKYISNKGKMLNSYIIATGEENYYLLAPNFKFIKKDKIDYDTILDGVYVPDSVLKESFEEIEFCKFHSNFD